MSDQAEATEQAPEQRAIAAAEKLAAAEEKVTVRAIQKAAGVRLETARIVAKAWAEGQEGDAVPPMPDRVQTRVAGIWAEAYAAAREEFAEVRAGLVAEIDAAKTEANEFAEATAEAEHERDEAREESAKRDAELDKLKEQHEGAIAQLKAQHAAGLKAAETRALKAEGALEAFTARLPVPELRDKDA